MVGLITSASIFNTPQKSEPGTPDILPGNYGESEPGTPDILPGNYGESEPGTPDILLKYPGLTLYIGFNHYNWIGVSDYYSEAKA